MNRKTKGGRREHDVLTQRYSAKTHDGAADGALSRSHNRSAARTYIAIDIENILGGECDGTISARKFIRVLKEEVLRVQKGDTIHIGASHYTGKHLMFALSDLAAKWSLRSGKDGAESQMIADMDLRSISRHYSKVVVASADRAWAPVIRELRALGVQVLIVTGRGALSNELRELGVPLARIRETLRIPKVELAVERSAVIAAIQTVHAAAAVPVTPSTSRTHRRVHLDPVALAA